MGTDHPTPARFRLRDLPLSARLVLSAFLISVGCGYFAAMVQLHFQHAAGSGNALPSREQVIARFYGQHGEKPKSKMQLLLESEEDRPFNGTGTMRLAFTAKSGGWERAVKDRARKLTGRRVEPNDEQLKQATDELRKERDTERLAVLEWIEKGASKDAYEDDSFCVSNALATLPIDEEKFIAAPAADGGRTVKIKTVLDTRCVKCHAPDASSAAHKYPLDSYDGIAKYLEVKESQAISKEALIQSTHVHLLSFSMLYGLTGLIFAFTCLPRVVRCVIAPLPLVAQMVDIACWWLTRLDPRFADGIIIAGGVVAAGLGMQIVLSLFSMYGKPGKLVLLLLLVGGGVAGWQAKERYIDPYLAAEKAAPAPAAAEK
jgi:hypothetical protein